VSKAGNTNISLVQFWGCHDYEVNMKAELETLSLHEQIAEIREMKWGELITMQQEQLRLLTQLMKRHVSADGKHPATSS